MGLQEILPSAGSLAGGVCAGLGWVLWIDGVVGAYTEFGLAVNGAYWIPGMLQMLSLLMVNAINWSLLTDDAFDEGISARVKLFVFVAFVFAFSGLFGALWILVSELNGASDSPGGGDAGLKCLLQNLFLFAGSLLFRIGRTKEE
uniref:Transmembrane protein 50A n=1 Tax=Chrysotila carterae TaxID=13221 RepID=A0A7S4B6S1_CHRCT|mmetsp:Transcript_4829/g.10491  ORF Transcript_4829/g.10491 Transcript_4829/m.10491 type:complete len:145 (+) Transcript_4829:383-817(+)